MKNQLNAFLLSAALTGLMGGTVAAHAATTGTTAKGTSATAAKAGLRYTSSAADKHSCKGQERLQGPRRLQVQ